MFREELKTKLKDIFQVKKVTFDIPAGETAEQETLFIDVKSARSSVRNGMVYSRVQGIGSMYAPANVLAYGFFSKRIQLAGSEKTKKFFFYEIEENKGRYQNVIERAFNFVFYFEKQFDPDQGTIEGIELTVTEGD